MKEFKLVIKKLYRYLVKFFFLILYGKIYTTNKGYSGIKVKIINNNKIKKFNSLNYKIYSIKNGRACTDGVEQVAYISEKNIIKEISYTQIKGNLVSAKNNFVINKGTPYFLKKFNGNVLSLAQGASGDSNYFHWMFDILPKIKITSLYYKLENIDYFYMPELQNFQKKILKLIGLKKIKFINSNKYKHIQADNLIVPEHPWYFKGRVSKEAKKLPHWIVNWIRNIFLKNFKYNSRIKKIFIDRSESKYNHCKLINNNEIITFLRHKGFKSYQVGKLSLEKQISLFNNAKVIVGPHGAAFTNLIFCKAGTKVIEIIPKNRPDNYQIISKINKLKYKKIIMPLSKKKNINGDMYINPKKILKDL